MHRLKSRKDFSKGILFLFLMLSALSACTENAGSVGISTWTPSPSATPTCEPNINLSTPVGWDTSSRLVIILFDPNLIKNQGLELLNGDKTQNVTEFVNHIIPEIVKPGDQISVFKLGYRQYQNARFFRAFSYIEVPQLYDTPSPNEELTPITVGEFKPDGLAGIATVNAIKAQETAHAGTATALIAEDNCKKAIWNESAIFTATSWAQTEIAEINSVSTNAANAATQAVDDKDISETPYADNVVYEGLYHASIDIEGDCEKYNECILLIVDDLNTWTRGNQGDFDISLKGIDLVYNIMPNCRDINQPSCKTLQEFWNDEFMKYGAFSVVYHNGDRAERNLLSTLGR